MLVKGEHLPLVALALHFLFGVAEPARAQEFDPLIQEMIEQISDSLYTSSIRRLQSFSTRYELSDSIIPAAQWLSEQFLAMGSMNVELDSFSWIPSVVDTPIVSRNVIATKPGGDLLDSLVVLGGHYDSIVHFSRRDPYTPAPGANDNASGIAGVLEIARILQPYSFSRTIVFACFAGEEVGLGGSSDYVSRLREEGKGLRFGLVLDMIAYQETAAFFDPIIDGDLRYLDEAVRTLQLAFLYSDRLTPSLGFGYHGSDHNILGLYGPSLLLLEGADGRDPLFHRPSDVLDSLDVPYAVEILKMALASVADAAGLLPVGIRSPAGAARAPIRRMVGLGPNYPNPFNPSTTIPFDIPGGRKTSQGIRVSIYDIRGARVRQLIEGEREPGSYAAVWDGRDDHGLPVPSGIYICSVRAGSVAASRKLTLLR